MRVGIDLDTWKLTLCASGPDVVLFEQAKIRERGHSLFDAVQGIPSALAFAFSRLGVVVDEVYVERGRGMFRTADFELGAVWGATAIAVRRCLPDVHVETVEVHEWKKAVTAAVGLTTKKGVPGVGNTSKAVANRACLTLLHRRGINGSGLSPDHLDAYGIVASVELGSGEWQGNPIRSLESGSGSRSG